MKTNFIQNLVYEFSKLPGIGAKTAEKFVYFLLEQNENELDKMILGINDLKKVRRCKQCFNFSYEQDLCSICSDAKRDQKKICVVAEIQTIETIEKTNEFSGLYHILGGYLSPSDGITPDKLKIKELVLRIQNHKTEEVILALNPNIEGEATGMYLSKILQPYNVKITRLARGLPRGADLDYADEITLGDALKYRKEIK